MSVSRTIASSPALAAREQLMLARYADSLAALPEEYDPARRRLAGNFPQAFSHVGLVNSAFNLARRDLAHEGGPGI